MKTIKTILSMALCLCFLIFAGCSTKVIKFSSENNTDSNTKDYYKNLGYVNVKFDSCFSIDGDLVYFNDGTVFVKSQSNISIELTSENFAECGSQMVKFTTSEILESIDINGTSYSLNSLEADGYLVKGETEIKPILKSFKIFGVALVVDDPTINDADALQVHDETLFRIKNLLFIKSASGDLENGAETSALDSNVEFRLTKSNKNLNFLIEFNSGDLTYNCYAIAKTDEDAYFLLSLNKTDNEFKLDSSSPLGINIEIVKSLREK